jgi:hypothetical protein
MDNKKTMHMLIVVNLIVLVLITAAVPLPRSSSVASSSENSDLVSL